MKNTSAKADGDITLSRRGVGAAVVAVASSGCLSSRESRQESAFEVVSVSEDGPVASASVHVDPGLLPRMGSLVFAIRLEEHESEWQGPRIALTPPEGSGDSTEYTPDMTEVSLKNEQRVPGTYAVSIVHPNSIEGRRADARSEIVVNRKAGTDDADS